jgi:DNA-binding XRE family transcriptional regulator
MSTEYTSWAEVKAKGQELDPRTERSTGQAAAQERREAYVRGHQLAEMRKTAGPTQAQLTEALGISQARISKIEHGEISGIEIIRAYVVALGGTVDLVATLGDHTRNLA